MSNSIIINNKNFDLEKTFECGQCFRFDKTENGYSGVVGDSLLELSYADGGIRIDGIDQSQFDGFFRNYFDLDTDYDAVNELLCRDSVLEKVVPFSSGIRILRQMPFETLVSFIISASNNIPRIKKIVSALCECFGDKKERDGKTYYTFPTAERLAGLSVCDLAPIRAGFRDKYIIDCATKVATGQIDLDAVSKQTMSEAAVTLMQINGVGQKVADCALLFGFGFKDSFPKDVWIKRVLKNYYGTETEKDLNFYGYGGIAQQYLFYYAREHQINDIIAEV